MSKAGHAIQSIKPVFMMSPLSIANFLPPGALTFDLIIFDEASQVRPVDALGAIVRGQQVVVVGDSRQLPPTSFFDSLITSEESEPDDQTAPTSDIESVLGLFCSRGAHQRMLRWHYRSRHESLIAVSNHLFYDDRLVVFPSPDRGREKLGLMYRRVENAPYDRSRTRTNAVEAKVVAEAAMAHARIQIKLSCERRETLGVVAFSVAQEAAIRNQLELLRRADPSCEEYFSAAIPEGVFVKNLETVQGHERDVIFISIGYGRTADHGLSMSFGPLNRAGGGRRLNVLITRARKRCEVFTTLTANDISETSASGVAALKTFLHYAQTRNLAIPQRTELPPNSFFEKQVLHDLTALGFDVHMNVGSAGFSLDFAVVDAAIPGRYLLGIQCDGAGYHSARSARDRDRLRQTVLEGLGWRIYRIWSTSWSQNPDQELRKLVHAIKTLSNDAPVAPPQAQFVPEPELQPLRPLRSSRIKYKTTQLTINLGSVDISLVDGARLADLLARVVAVESPVHWKEASRRVVNASGTQRFGTRIQRAFEDATRIGVSRKLFVEQGGFLWDPAMLQPSVRDRSDLPASCRKLDLIAPEEIRCAILTVVKESRGISPDELPAAVCRLFGFIRVSAEMIDLVTPHTDALLREGQLALQGSRLIPAIPS